MGRWDEGASKSECGLFFTSEILSLVIMRVSGLVGVGVKGVAGGPWVDVTCTNCTYLTQ